MDLKESFDILGLPFGASEEDVKKAYKQKALLCHPDKNPHDPSAKEKFQQIGLAYETIVSYARNEPEEQEFFDSELFNFIVLREMMRRKMRQNFFHGVFGGLFDDSDDDDDDGFGYGGPSGFFGMPFFGRPNFAYSEGSRSRSHGQQYRDRAREQFPRQSHMNPKKSKSCKTKRAGPDQKRGEGSKAEQRGKSDKATKEGKPWYGERPEYRDAQSGKHEETEKQPAPKQKQKRKNQTQMKASDWQKGRKSKQRNKKKQMCSRTSSPSASRTDEKRDMDDFSEKGASTEEGKPQNSGAELNYAASKTCDGTAQNENLHDDVPVFQESANDFDCTKNFSRSSKEDKHCNTDKENCQAVISANGGNATQDNDDMDKCACKEVKEPLVGNDEEQSCIPQNKISSLKPQNNAETIQDSACIHTNTPLLGNRECAAKNASDGAATQGNVTEKTRNVDLKHDRQSGKGISADSVNEGNSKRMTKAAKRKERRSESACVDQIGGSFEDAKEMTRGTSESHFEESRNDTEFQFYHSKEGSCRQNKRDLPNKASKRRNSVDKEKQPMQTEEKKTQGKNMDARNFSSSTNRQEKKETIQQKKENDSNYIEKTSSGNMDENSQNHEAKCGINKSAKNLSKDKGPQPNSEFDKVIITGKKKSKKMEKPQTDASKRAKDVQNELKSSLKPSHAEPGEDSNTSVPHDPASSFKTSVRLDSDSSEAKFESGAKEPIPDLLNDNETKRRPKKNDKCRESMQQMLEEHNTTTIWKRHVQSDNQSDNSFAAANAWNTMDLKRRAEQFHNEEMSSKGSDWW